MGRSRVVRSLNAATAAYIAGLIDGEGTITLTRLHRNENRRLVVCIANNDFALLNYVRIAIGAGRITSKRTYKSRHAPSFTYQISSRQALGLLRQVVTYLWSYKKTRALLALSCYVRLTPRNGRYTPEVVAARRMFEHEFLAIKPAAVAASADLGRTNSP